MKMFVSHEKPNLSALERQAPKVLSGSVDASGNFIVFVDGWVECAYDESGQFVMDSGEIANLNETLTRHNQVDEWDEEQRRLREEFNAREQGA